MTKAEYIERYGIEWYERYKARRNARMKEYYKNNPEYREYQKQYYKNNPEYREAKKEYQKAYYKNRPECREYQKEYIRNDLNSNGKTKNNIRRQSRRILLNKRHHAKLKGYEIHHCFGYDDPNKFVYVPKSLHIKIHQFLRDNEIDADSNHFKYIANMINECTEYTYISF